MALLNRTGNYRFLLSLQGTETRLATRLKEIFLGQDDKNLLSITYSVELGSQLKAKTKAISMSSMVYS